MLEVNGETTRSKACGLNETQKSEETEDDVNSMGIGKCEQQQRRRAGQKWTGEMIKKTNYKINETKQRKKKGWHWQIRFTMKESAKVIKRKCWKR